MPRDLPMDVSTPLPAYVTHLDEQPAHWCEPNREARPPASTGYWLCALVVVLWLPLMLAVFGILG